MPLTASEPSSKALKTSAPTSKASCGHPGHGPEPWPVPGPAYSFLQPIGIGATTFAPHGADAPLFHRIHMNNPFSRRAVALGLLALGPLAVQGMKQTLNDMALGGDQTALWREREAATKASAARTFSDCATSACTPSHRPRCSSAALPYCPAGTPSTIAIDSIPPPKSFARSSSGPISTWLASVPYAISTRSLPRRSRRCPRPEPGPGARTAPDQRSARAWQSRQRSAVGCACRRAAGICAPQSTHRP